MNISLKQNNTQHIVKTSSKGLGRFKANWVLYAMLVPALCFLILFNYLPMFGIIMAFQKFIPMKGFFNSEFVGLYWFKYMLFNSPDFFQVFYNTFVISLAKIICSNISAIIFAILLNEARNRFYKKFVQTITYLPNFLSWVIVGGIFIDLLSPDGIINQMLHFVGVSESISFLSSNAWFKSVIIATDTWKSFGFSAIVYIAAITGINQEQYEAACIDGAGRLKKIFHITVPGIVPIIVMMLTLGLNQIMSGGQAGQDQILMMYNPAVYQSGDIIDTFVYRAGLIGAQYSFGAAIGLFKSIIACIFVLTANQLSIKLTNSRIF